ncbi:MAG: ASPIC/UnbV domain-containing protein, partial [bacterium]
VKIVGETASGTRSIHKRVSTGGSFGASTLRVEIGLGSIDTIRRVIIHWPIPGSVDQYDDVSINRRYLIEEGATKAERIPLPAAGH